MRSETDDSDAIRSVQRALRVLRIMNRRLNWALHELQADVVLPKTTLFRILKTLQIEGYVRVDLATGNYRLSGKVEELASGVTEKLLVVDRGSQIALQITKRIKWPLAIGTLDGDAIVVRYSTMPYSPVAVQATTLGHRLGLLETAMGRVYLAHCDSAERDILLRHILDNLPLAPVSSRRDIEQDLSRIAATGYAVRLPNWQRGSATLAVPIQTPTKLLGSLSMTTFGRSMTPKLVADHLPVILQTANDIGRACSD